MPAVSLCDMHLQLLDICLIHLTRPAKDQTKQEEAVGAASQPAMKGGPVISHGADVSSQPSLRFRKVDLKSCATHVFFIREGLSATALQSVSAV